MRYILALALGFTTGGLALTQPPPKVEEGPPTRFGYPYRDKAFPQFTPKETLESVVLAIEKADMPYLVSNLIDPAFIDARLLERARQLEPSVEQELVELRNFQQQNLDRVAPDARIPNDPVKVRAMVAERAREQAFKQLVRDVQEKLIEDPESAKDLRRFLRLGDFPADAAAGMTFRLSLADVKDRALFFRKVGERWYIENKQFDDGPPPVPQAPDEKIP